MRVGIASDHGGFALKGQIAESLRSSAYEVVDFGAHQLNPGDDYPDFVVPLARAVASGGCVKRNLGELGLDGERLRMSCESRGAACAAFSTARKDFFSVLVGGLLN